MKKGFTLIELVVVVAIISILITLIVPNILGYLSNAKQKRIDAAAKSLYTAAVSQNIEEKIASNDNAIVSIYPIALKNYLSDKEIEALTALSVGDDENTKMGENGKGELKVLIKEGEVISAQIKDIEGNLSTYPKESENLWLGDLNIKETNAKKYNNNISTFTSSKVEGGYIYIKDAEKNLLASYSFDDKEKTEGILKYKDNSTSNNDISRDIELTDVDEDLIKDLVDDTILDLESEVESEDCSVQIYLPQNITKIGDNACSEVGSVSKIVLPTTTKTIGENAFAQTSPSNLVVEIPTSVEAIGSRAMSNIRKENIVCDSSTDLRFDWIDLGP